MWSNKMPHGESCMPSRPAAHSSSSSSSRRQTRIKHTGGYRGGSNFSLSKSRPEAAAAWQHRCVRWESVGVQISFVQRVNSALRRRSGCLLRYSSAAVAFYGLIIHHTRVKKKKKSNGVHVCLSVIIFARSLSAVFLPRCGPT